MMLPEERRALVETADENLERKRKTHKSLIAVIVLITAFALAQAWAAIVANSLAVFSDSIHMLFDVLTYAVNLYANWDAMQEIMNLRHFGHRSTKLEIAASIFSAACILVLSITMMSVAIWRLVFSEVETVVNGELMLYLALIGFAVNGLSLLFLHSAGTMQELNVKSAVLHIFADVARGVAIVAAGLLVYFFNWNWADSLCTIVVAAFMLIGSGYVLVECRTELKTFHDEQKVPSTDV